MKVVNVMFALSDFNLETLLQIHEKCVRLTMINITFLRTYIFCKDLSFRVPNLMLNISLHHLQYQDKFATFCFCDSKSISLQLIETALQRLQRIAMWEFIYLFMETTELSGVRPIMLPPRWNHHIIEPNLLYLLTTEKYLSISKVWKV